MRDLFILRGLPLSGKTSWCIDNSLSEFRLCLDHFACALQGRIFDVSGDLVRPCSNDKIAHEMLLVAVDTRMRRGDTVVLDDNHLSNSYLNVYKQCANKYMYRSYVVDFSSVDIDDIMRRDTDGVYDRTTLESMLRLLKESSLCMRDTHVIKPSELKKVHSGIQDLSSYRRIVHIGDIHGCYGVLRKSVQLIRDEEFYIFMGDYIDKGSEHFEVIEFLTGIGSRNNVVLLEGNHERNILSYVNGSRVTSKDFKLNTLPKLLSKGFNRQLGRRFYKLLRQVFCYKYGDKTVLCSHGGFSTMPDVNLVCADLAVYGCASHGMIRDMAMSFDRNTPANVYQVFSRGDSDEFGTCLENKSYVLESNVESGGDLRLLYLDEDGFHDVRVRNEYSVSDEHRKRILHTQQLFASMESASNFFYPVIGLMSDHFPTESDSTFPLGYDTSGCHGLLNRILPSDSARTPYGRRDHLVLFKHKYVNLGFSLLRTIATYSCVDQSSRGDASLASEPIHSAKSNRFASASRDVSRHGNVGSRRDVIVSRKSDASSTSGLPSLVLFDVLDWAILMRGYDVSFFTTVSYDSDKLEFPLSVFSADSSDIAYISMHNGDLYTYTSYGLNHPENEHVFASILDSRTSTIELDTLPPSRPEHKIDILRNILASYNVTLAFCVDAHGELVLQDGICNDVLQASLDYYALTNIAGMLQVRIKRCIVEAKDKLHFYTFMRAIMTSECLSDMDSLSVRAVTFCDKSGTVHCATTYLHNEWKVLEFVVRTWNRLMEVCDSQWISTDFRRYFLEWFRANDMLGKDLDHVRSSFMSELERKVSK